MTRKRRTKFEKYYDENIEERRKLIGKQIRYKGEGGVIMQGEVIRVTANFEIEGIIFWLKPDSPLGFAKKTYEAGIVEVL